MKEKLKNATFSLPVKSIDNLKETVKEGYAKSLNSEIRLRDENDIIQCTAMQVSENDTGSGHIVFSQPWSFIVPDGWDYYIFASLSGATYYLTYTTKIYLNTIE